MLARKHAIGRWVCQVAGCHGMRGNSNNSKDENLYPARARLFNIYCFLFCQVLRVSNPASIPVSKRLFFLFTFLQPRLQDGVPGVLLSKV